MAQTWSVIRGDVETQISGGTLSYRVAATNIGAPPKRTIATRGVFQNGQSFYSSRYSKRILSLVFFADAASLVLADAMRDDIYELWRGIEGETVTLKVTRDDGSVRLIDGEVVNVIDFPDVVGDRYGASQRFAVQLECHNPFWRSQSLVIKNITVNGTSTLTYDGQFPTEPIINIVGPITNPVLTQVVTGKKLDFTGTTISAGNNYQIDTRYGYKTVLDSALTSRIANLTSDSNLADFTHGTFIPNNGKKWDLVTIPETNIWRSVAYGNGVWVAIAESGTNQVMRSTNDGATWSAVASTEANFWISLAYGNGVWVAVALTGTNRIMRSTDDGVTWSAVAAPEANFWQSVAYGNGVWMAVATNGTNRVMRSTDDGVTWSAVFVGTNQLRQAIGYGNNVWIVVGAYANIIRSTDDGITWTSINAPIGNFRSVKYGNGVWIAVGEIDSYIIRSTDNGMTWTSISPPGLSTWQSVAYGNGVWIAVANTGTNRIMRSTNDGASWSETEPVPFAPTLLSVASDGDIWIIVGFIIDNASLNNVAVSFDEKFYKLTGTGTTSATAATMIYNNLFLGI